MKICAVSSSFEGSGSIANARAATWSDAEPELSCARSFLKDLLRRRPLCDDRGRFMPSIADVTGPNDSCKAEGQSTSSSSKFQPMAGKASPS